MKKILLPLVLILALCFMLSCDRIKTPYAGKKAAPAGAPTYTVEPKPY